MQPASGWPLHLPGLRRASVLEDPRWPLLPPHLPLLPAGCPALVSGVSLTTTLAAPPHWRRRTGCAGAAPSPSRCWSCARRACPSRWSCFPGRTSGAASPGWTWRRHPRAAARRSSDSWQRRRHPRQRQRRRRRRPRWTMRPLPSARRCAGGSWRSWQTCRSCRCRDPPPAPLCCGAGPCSCPRLPLIALLS